MYRGCLLGGVVAAIFKGSFLLAPSVHHYLKGPSVLAIDIETRSAVDLRKSNPYAYSEDPSFQVLMCAWNDGGDTRIAIGHDQIAQIPGLFDPDVLKVAHNAQFERVCLSAMHGMAPGTYLDPRQFLDTAALAGVAGLPQSLEALAKALGAQAKDSAGTRLINWFCKPYRDGFRQPEDDPDKWQEFIDYCIQDVDTLVDIYRLLPIQQMPPDEWRVWMVDQQINDHGLAVDLDLAWRAVQADKQNTDQAHAAQRELLGIDNAGSVPQVLGALQGLGLRLPDLRAATIADTLADPDLPDQHRKPLELRLQASLVASKKYEAVLNSASADGRLRGQFRYYGAHTGRWSGKGVQFQNLPRAQVPCPQAAMLDLELGLGADPQTLKGLLRSVFVGPFTIADYSAIEARVLAWVAGEDWALEAFRDGRDIYVESANRMGGLSRQEGKVATLALGYQGSVGSLRNMGYGADLTDAQVKDLVVRWRKANTRIVSLWDQIEQTFRTGGRCRRVKIDKRGADRAIILPSGREIVYHDTNRMMEFTDHRGNRSHTYGGRLTENVVQAISRDVLGQALVNLAQAGYHTAGHCHDEVVVEGEHDVDRITSLMCVDPGWAPDLPMAAEGGVLPRYGKV